MHYSRQIAYALLFVAASLLATLGMWLYGMVVLSQHSPDSVQSLLGWRTIGFMIMTFGGSQFFLIVAIELLSNAKAGPSKLDDAAK